MATKTKVSDLQIYKSTNFSGLGETNHLSNAYLTEPEKLGSVLAYAAGIQADNVLSLLTGGIGNTVYVTNREYEWDLHSQSDRAIEVGQDSPSISGNLTPGYGGQPVLIPFAEKVFEATDDIVGDDGITTLHVITEPYQSGSTWMYTLVNTNPNPAAFIDPSLLKMGARWSKEWSSVEEFSTRGGGHEYSTPYKLKNQLTTLRKTYEVTREAHLAVMIIELFSPDGSKSTKLWTKLAEWTAMMKWYREIDRNMIYSVYNKNSKGEVTLQGDNKRPIYHGAGLREQISPANKRYYTKLTYAILDEFLLDLSYAASKWGGNHKFVALTGKMGMREFDNAIKEHARGNNITVTTAGTFISGKGSELDFDGYFQTVKFMNGIELTVKEFAPYDDIVRGRALHPISKKPIESYRFTILNFGMKDGKNNIQKIAMKDSEMAMWHVCGSTGPMDGVAKSIGTQRSSGIDGYQVNFLAQIGIRVQDPTSCGELILRVN